MTRSELIALVPNKPYRMPCCRECIGKSKKDCDENPLNCFDFYLLNKETIDKLSQKALKDGADNARYIDADKLEKHFIESVSKHNLTINGNDYPVFLADHTLHEIRNAPAADVAEVKHGYWIKTDELAGIEFLKCSVCGKTHPRARTEYCCDCGAKMKGGADNA